jgi:hypothetical protein
MRRFWWEQGKKHEMGAEGKTDDKEQNEEEEDDTEYTPEEYLQNVGEQVAAMLDPLGKFSHTLTVKDVTGEHVPRS